MLPRRFTPFVSNAAGAVVAAANTRPVARPAQVAEMPTGRLSQRVLRGGQANHSRGVVWWGSGAAGGIRAGFGPALRVGFGLDSGRRASSIGGESAVQSLVGVKRWCRVAGQPDAHFGNGIAQGCRCPP